MQKRLNWLNHRIQELRPGNWSIRQRLVSAGFVLSVLALSTPFYMWHKLSGLTENYNNASVDWSMLGKVHEFTQLLTDSESKLRAFATSGNREWLNSISKNTRNMEVALLQLRESAGSNPYRVTLVHDAYEVYREWYTSVILRYAQNSVGLERSKSGLETFARLLMGEPLAVRLHRLLSELSKDIHDSNMIVTRSVIQQSHHTMLTVTYEGIFFFVGFAGLMISLWYTLIPGLNALLVSARELKKGNLDYRVHIQGRSETTELARAFNEMAVSLKAQNEKLKELNRMKSDFVSTVSHELRTPLTAIKGSIGLILGGVTGSLPDEINQMLLITQKNTDRLIRLINEVLDIAKIEAGAIQMQFDKHSLFDTIEHAAESIESVAQTKGIALKWEKPNISPLVVIDRDRIEQVITNLISNAIKFTEPNGTVTVTCETKDKQVIVKVNDTGHGIPDEFLDRIFQKFQQAEGSRHKAKEGTGLGLTIAKTIVEEHGGKLWVESKVEEGSSFYFSLPWNGTDFVESRPAQTISKQNTSRKKILVVDDEVDFTTVMQVMLEHEGYEVVTTNSSRAALPIASKYIPDLIILDILMPELDGMELRRLLAELPETKDIPVAIVSVSPVLPDPKDQPASRPIEKIFSKPLVPDTFKQWLTEFFSSRSDAGRKAA